ncbi:unnamed protein product [Vitrella brassicaformis CCMP3155]|uniref:Peptidase A2 domain-containing protein n=1 Tax=Vitrella brassicaformis (strain CCMP3155) TaxID=1169540 RepID=A0A0G4EG65_VITBC|nr:unnamed protein product [Vitrella brassicaformis CCMP3155]|eukprot:CEL94712.1 unnamed protein product [Vitrella brassicaformis CCMP3155]
MRGTESVPKEYLATELFLNGEYLRFLVDTGSTQSILTSDTVSSLGAALKEQDRETYTAAGLPVKTGVARVEGVRVGGGAEGGMEVSLDAAVLTQAGVLPAGVAGLLGLDFLSQFGAIDVDFLEGKIKLYPKGQAAAAKAALQEAAADRKDLSLIATPVSSLPGPLLAIDGALSEQEAPVTAVLDLGSTYSIVNWPAARSVGIDREAEGVQRGVMKATGIDGAPIEVDRAAFPLCGVKGTDGALKAFKRDVKLNVADFPWFARAGLADKPAMLLGLDVLGAGRLLLNFEDQTLSLLRAPIAEKKKDVPISVSSISTSTADMDTKAADTAAAQQDAETKERIQVEFQSMQQKLAQRAVKFSELQDELKTAGVSYKDCRSTDELIRRVAETRVRGAAVVKKEQEEKAPPDPTAERMNAAVERLTNEFRSLDERGKRAMIESMATKLAESGMDKQFTKASELIREYARYEVSLQGKPTGERKKSKNEGTMSITNYSDEARRIKLEFDKVPEADKPLKLEEYKRELDERGVDYQDCTVERELINRLAYARVFGKPKGQPQRRRPDVVQESPMGYSDSSGLVSLFDSPFDRIFEEFFGDSWPFGSLSGGIVRGGPMGGMQQPGGRQINIFTEEGGDQQQQREQINVREEGEKPSPTPSPEELIAKETDADLKKFVDRTVGDSAGQKFLAKSLQDPTLRSLLKDVAQNGYDAVKARYKDDAKGLYFLERFRELNII